ncbi:MAG: apolipoprotein N-acyltransferase [Micromonosporaceae bacterium]
MTKVVAPADPADPEAPAAGPLPRWAAYPLSLVSGIALVYAFPPYDLWWLAPLAVAGLAGAAHRQRIRTGAGLGLLAGAVYFGPLLHWTAIDARIGWWPWLALTLFQASYVALLGAAAAATSRLADRRVWAWPLLVGALWLAQEALRSRAPFGGFPWGRLAFSQADSPLVWLAALGGGPLVTFGVAVTGGLVVAAGWRFAEHRRQPAEQAAAPVTHRFWLRGTALAGAYLLVPLSGLFIPYAPAAGEAVTVAIVQGNVPRIGLDFNAQRRAVLDNHVDATLELARKVGEDTADQPDLVIWPENASDIDPLLNDDAYQRISDAAAAIGAPILVGAVLRGPGEQTSNAGLVWLPGTGPTDRYVKQHPVPFAEYMPMRPLVRMITDKADLAGNFASGEKPGVLRVGPAVLGDVICFEVAYDNLVRDTVTGGANLLVVQTNNATFNESEARQQLAMVRLRAIEHGRPALMASTVGVSGFVAPDGTVTEASGFNTRHVAVRTFRLGTGRTLSTRLGVLPELLLSLAALAAVGTAILRRRATARTAAGEGRES